MESMKAKGGTSNDVISPEIKGGQPDKLYQY